MWDIVLVYGAIMSGILALIASGFTLVFGVTRTLNFAHGSYVLLGGYLTFGITQLTGFVLALPLSLISIGLLAVVIDKFLIRKMRTRHQEIIITIATGLVIQRIALIVFSNLPRSLPPFFKGIAFSFGGISISNMGIFTMVVAYSIIGLIYYFINKTRWGSSIDATAQDSEAAWLMGINVERSMMFVAFLSGVLAGLAGVFYAQIYSISLDIYLNGLLYAFIVVILGGFGSIKGSVVGSVITGFLIIGVQVAVGASWSYIVLLLFILVLLTIRPQGLFGKEVSRI